MTAPIGWFAAPRRARCALMAGVVASVIATAAPALADEDFSYMPPGTLVAGSGTGRADATLAPRLALWGRRLVGESLNVVQHVLAQHAEIAALLSRSLPGDEPQARLFARMTAEHTRRMDRLGLPAEGLSLRRPCYRVGLLRG